MTPTQEVFLCVFAAAFIVWGIAHFDAKAAAVVAIIVGIVALGVAFFGDF